VIASVAAISVPARARSASIKASVYNKQANSEGSASQHKDYGHIVDYKELFAQVSPQGHDARVGSRGNGRHRGRSNPVSNLLTTMSSLQFAGSSMKRRFASSSYFSAVWPGRSTCFV
jgi:hypothetical protein